MNWFKRWVLKWNNYDLYNYHKLINIDVEFKIATKGCKDMLTINETLDVDVKHENLIYDEGSWYNSTERRKLHNELYKTFKPIIDRRAKVLLQELRNKGYCNGKDLVFVKGNHFITNKWSMSLNSDRLSFNDFVVEYEKENIK